MWEVRSSALEKDRWRGEEGQGLIGIGGKWELVDFVRLGAQRV